MALAESGHLGVHLLILGAHLGAQGLKLAPKGGAASSLYKLLRLPALHGTKRLDLDGQEYSLHGYYPALMPPDEWSELQHLAADRSRRRGRGDIVGLITGIVRSVRAA